MSEETPRQRITRRVNELLISESKEQASNEFARLSNDDFLNYFDDLLLSFKPLQVEVIRNIHATYSALYEGYSIIDYNMIFHDHETSDVIVENMNELVDLFVSFNRRKLAELPLVCDRWSSILDAYMHLQNLESKQLSRCEKKRVKDMKKKIDNVRNVHSYVLYSFEELRVHFGFFNEIYLTFYADHILSYNKIRICLEKTRIVLPVKIREYIINDSYSNATLHVEHQPEEEEENKEDEEKELYRFEYDTIYDAFNSTPEPSPQCGICLENDYDENDGTNPCCKLKCGHFFHHDHIERWLEIKTNCPICRGDVK
jgi:hypothetical protein